MNFRRLGEVDGSWQALVDQWRNECREFGEDFSDYAPGTIEVLNSLIEKPLPPGRAGVFALAADGRYQLVCQVNRADIKGFNGKVLRVRHILLSPRFDFGDDVGLNEYAAALEGLFLGVITLSNQAEMSAPHIKFHMRSPADYHFFEEFVREIRDNVNFESVVKRGAWVYISKRRHGI